MKSRRAYAELALWTVAAIAAADVALRAPAPSTPRETGAASVAPGPAPELWSADSLLVWTTRVHDAPPFRVDRQAAIAATESAATLAPPTFAPPAPQVPLPRLTGVVGSPDAWSAILSGVPGASVDLLVRTGDTLPGGLRVRRIRRDTVVIDAPDTTWILTSGRTR